ncbi:MAG: IclR family transcriptional regulator [Betaproteobacteria bacterium]|nr:IclR family transcriptional regulator [Betaproteobacteria bacterium]MDH5220632.1 IclR family transcriptional regulator [Betaproteobacteria bacterium]MDH5350550.1 IclR family transcriptional regulator [Betaproteobacteria bacterium]
MVKSADRTLQILEAFAAAGEPLGIAELARRLAIPVSACYALLRTLELRGYLYELGLRKGWYPTLRWLQKARAIAEHDPMLERVAPILEALGKSAGETIVFGKRSGAEVVYLNVVESPHPIRYSAQPGDRKPLHSSSAGKAILGALPPAERTALLGSLRLARITPNTIVRRELLEKDLEAGAKRGWYATRGENVADVHALGAPVRLDGELYAVVIAGPAHRIESALKSLAAALLHTARRLEGRA